MAKAEAKFSSRIRESPAPPVLTSPVRFLSVGTGRFSTSVFLLDARRTSLPDLEASELFTGMLHNRLGRIVVKSAGIQSTTPLRLLSETEMAAAARQCADFRLPVRGVDGFEAAQVTAGGLLTEGFNPETLESRLHPGLFA